MEIFVTGILISLTLCVFIAIPFACRCIFGGQDTSLIRSVSSSNTYGSL